MLLTQTIEEGIVTARLVQMESDMANYNFTDPVRQVLAMAREEGIRLGHDYVGTEHILLALLREGEGVAAAVLRDVAGREEIAQRVLENVRRGRATVALGELPYTSRAKKVLEFAMAAARQLDHSYVGTEHILLGLIREDKGIAAQALQSFGFTYNRVLARVMTLLDPTAVTPVQSAFRIQVDDSSEHSIYEQIIAQVQEGVATGVLQPGDRLPTVRQLADELDIAPGTVARAYSELERLAVVVTEGARGTRIAERTKRMAETPDKPETLAGLLRPVAVAAFHLGATAADLRAALERAMYGIFDPPTPENR
jgi:DNA-binding transcriptional regulator YhcF (GntR family)